LINNNKVFISLIEILQAIESLRAERERLVSSTNPSSKNGKKSRRRSSTNQKKPIDAQTPVRSLVTFI
jgi:hypothetical protein